MKITTKQIAQTGLLLALCIASQFLKNTSVYITGPIVNVTIIIAVLAVGLGSGILISVIAPVTSYLITASPLISAIPWIMPMIMIGNCILAVCVWLFEKKFRFPGRLPAGLVAGSVLKAAFMTLAIVKLLFTVYASSLSDKQLAMGRITFSTTQLITSLIGSVLAFLIWIPLKKDLNNSDPFEKISQ